MAAILMTRLKTQNGIKNNRLNSDTSWQKWNEIHTEFTLKVDSNLFLVKTIPIIVSL